MLPPEKGEGIGSFLFFQKRDNYLSFISGTKYHGHSYGWLIKLWNYTLLWHFFGNTVTLMYIQYGKYSIACGNFWDIHQTF